MYPINRELNCTYHVIISYCTCTLADSALYKLLSSDPSRDAEEVWLSEVREGVWPSRDAEGVWLSEVREVYCEEVQRKGTLPNDRKIKLEQIVRRREVCLPLSLSLCV